MRHNKCSNSLGEPTEDIMPDLITVNAILIGFDTEYFCRMRYLLAVY
jgi:hypothetical protein